MVDSLLKAGEAVGASNLSISHRRVTLPRTHNSLGVLRTKAVAVVWHLPSQPKVDLNSQTRPIKLRAVPL